MNAIAFDKKEFWFWCRAAVVMALPSFLFSFVMVPSVTAMLLVIALFILAFTAATSSAWYQPYQNTAWIIALRRAYKLRKILIVITLFSFVLNVGVHSLHLVKINPASSINLFSIINLLIMPIYLNDIISAIPSTKLLSFIFQNNDYNGTGSGLNGAFLPTFLLTFLHGITLNLSMVLWASLFYAAAKLPRLFKRVEK